MTRYAAKVDEAHSEIRDGLREIYPVWDCSKYGRGFPDLLVFAHGRFVLLEVKSRYGKLTDYEQEFAEMFPDAPVFTVRSLEEALGACSG